MLLFSSLAFSIPGFLTAYCAANSSLAFSAPRTQYRGVPLAFLESNFVVVQLENTLTDGADVPLGKDDAVVTLVGQITVGVQELDLVQPQRHQTAESVQTRQLQPL